jgi:choice-of-anchor B domain-containing protein
MSRRGNCWDNAVAESFFSSLKKERVRKRIYKTRDLAATDEPAGYLGWHRVAAQRRRRGENSAGLRALGSGPAQCINGKADGFACNAIRLEKNVTLAQLGGGSGNDIWGWVDPLNADEYAIVGLNNGVAFVNVTTPDTPIVVGRMPAATTNAAWRDIKVAQNHAYVVADNAGSHGMQVFDLTRLRGAGPNQTFAADVIYGDFAEAHNLAIDEQAGFAYALGSDTCGGGLHMINISTPLNPMFAGCHSADGYTHDAQCVVYTGPDTDHAGKEICFASNESHVVIVDVTIKASPVTLADFVYPDLGYTHQNWLTEDQRFLLVDDEKDEQATGRRTRTIVVDVSDLDAPVYLYGHLAAIRSVDHNLYVRGNKVYQANYTAGLRVLAFSSLATDTLTEVAYFDTRPENDAVTYAGAWSVYPYFPSGTIIVSDEQRGLFVLSQ